MNTSNFSRTTIIELAAIISKHLAGQNINVVLVGGLAVEIYSENIYLTKDIDMVDISYTAAKALNLSMAEIGFTKKGRVYVNPTTVICVEFPAAPLYVGNEMIVNTTVTDVSAGQIPVLLAKDVIKDRLAAHFHWNDKPSLVQALAVMSKHPIDQKELERFCRSEGIDGDAEKINKLQIEVSKRRLTNMSEIESLVIEFSVEQL